MGPVLDYYWWAMKDTNLLKVLPLAFVLALAVTACGDDDDSASSTSEVTTAQDSSTSTDDTDNGDNGDTSTSTDSTTPTTEDTGTTGGGNDLPGEPWDGFASEGDIFSVMGVAHDDELNVRQLPDAGSAILTSVGPTADDLVATGQARLLPSSAWYEMTVDGQTGWVSVGFVAFMGGTDDVTAEYLDGQSPPTAETMVDLAAPITESFASDEPPSRIVQSVAPTVGDLGEVTYDVVGLGDDALGGYRLHIFATPDESGESFTLKSIERTLFCTRGTTDGFCN
jgi:hypothetical protein